MSKTTLKPGSQETVQEAEVLAPDETALAQVNKGAVARRSVKKNPLIQAAGVDGVPLRPCYMDFAYSVSPWNDGRFSDGCFVIDKEVEIGKAAGTPLTVILVEYSKYLAECRYGSSGAKSGALNKFDTAEEADAAGEIVARDDVTPGCKNTIAKTRADPSLMGTVSVAYDLYMFVRKPEGLVSDKFVFKLGDHWYAYVKLSLVKGMGRDMKRDLVGLCAWEGGVRGVKPGEGECNRYLLDLAIVKTKQVKNGVTKTFTGLKTCFHKGADGAPQPVPAEAIRDILSLAETGEEIPDAAEGDDCPL